MTLKPRSAQADLRTISPTDKEQGEGGGIFVAFQCVSFSLGRESSDMLFLPHLATPPSPSLTNNPLAFLQNVIQQSNSL